MILFEQIFKQMYVKQFFHRAVRILLTGLGAALVLGACATTSRQNSALPEPYLREGLVTSNTYQLHLKVLADSRREAADLALPRARKRAYKMILKEPSVRAGLSQYSRNKIEDLVRKKGSVVYAARVSEEEWVVVFQVYKRGLWDYLRKMY